VGEPGEADNTVISLRVVFTWATKYKLFRGDDPTAHVAFIRDRDGHHTWLEEQLERYRRHWRIGTGASARCSGSALS
jgi:hypothetical protein